MSITTTYAPRIEIYRFPLVLVVGAVLLSILLQVYVPLYFPFFSLFDLPLLVVIYFSLSRRNPSTGLLLGCLIGLLQDALSAHPIGLFGMAKTLVGFTASSLSSRFDTDNFTARLLLVFLFYLLHNFIFVSSQLWLLNLTADFLSLQVFKAALVNPILGVLVFALLDRFRRTS